MVGRRGRLGWVEPGNEHQPRGLGRELFDRAGQRREMVDVAQVKHGLNNDTHPPGGQTSQKTSEVSQTSEVWARGMKRDLRGFTNLEVSVKDSSYGTSEVCVVLTRPGSRRCHQTYVTMPATDMAEPTAAAAAAPMTHRRSVPSLSTNSSGSP